MAKKLNILVGTVAYNNLKFTKNFLKTIKSQHYLTKIIIDNGSRDGTREFCEEFVKKENQEATCLFRNEGVAYAWNMIIEYALQIKIFSYILIAGNDTLLHKNCIDELVKTAEKTNAMIVTATNCSPGSKNYKVIDRIKIPQPEKHTPCPDFSCFLIRTKDILKLKELERGKEFHPGMFDTNFYPAYFEDNDYHQRLKITNLKAIKTNKAIYYHFGSQTKNQNPEIQELVSETYLENERYYCRKWGGNLGHEKSERQTVI